jgi:VanZ family protein
MHVVALILLILAGALLVNGVPHFVMGAAGRRWRTPFGQHSSARRNLWWGLGNIVVGFALALVVSLALGVDRLSFVWFSVGALVMVVMFGVGAKRFFAGND